MGEVFVAEQTGVGDFRKQLALKLMLADLASDPQHVKLFLAEASIAARLLHPNIVQVFDAGLIDGRYFIAMELIDGVTLAAVVKALRTRNELVSADVLCHVARQSLDALDYVHSAKDEQGRALELVHRDVSPSNLLLTTRGEVKLSDFGIAKMRDSESHTAPGEVRGKLAYLSPELILGATATSRSDLYALGMTLYRLAALTSPFAGSESELIAATRAQRTPLSSHRPDLPAAIINAIERSLAASPAERFSSAAAMRDAFPRGDVETRARELATLVTTAQAMQPPPNVALVSPAPGTKSIDVEVVTNAPADASVPTVLEHVPVTLVERPKWLWWLGAGGVIAAFIAILAVVWSQPPITPPMTAAPADVSADLIEPPRVVDAGIVAAVEPPAIDAGIVERVDAGALIAETEITEVKDDPAKPPRKVAARLTSPAFVSVQAEPWANVELNGKPIGQTPLARVPVSTPNAVLRLTNPKFRAIERKLKLSAGEDLKVNEKLVPR
ncbi:MAG: protein kinase [Archangium sp.]|nr:protein kinase [Archangium sp.]